MNTRIRFRFIDSFKFMSSSLDQLASYLTDFQILKQEFSNYNDEMIKLLCRKCVFPYEYVDSPAKLEETELPSIENFHSMLTGTSISQSEYEYAQNIWRLFNIETLGQFQDLYMRVDVILLAEVFENFRNNCLQSYFLDPSYFYTAPGLSWNAMLRYTDVKLALIDDIDQMMFVESSIRGGISQCSNRYSIANNRYMRNFDNKKDETYISYFDINNLVIII